jgi:cytochrome c oxidase subunit IV
MSNTAHSPTAHESEHDHHHVEHFKKHIKACIAVFIALLVLTVVTVLVSYVELGTKGNVTLALIIATFKALLVAAYFMHLNSEKYSIYRILAFTFAFFVGLMGLTLWALNDHIVY